MLNTPLAEQIGIVLYGLRNSGKSSLINAITDAIGNNDLTMPATPQKVWAAARAAGN